MAHLKSKVKEIAKLNDSLVLENKKLETSYAKL